MGRLLCTVSRVVRVVGRHHKEAFAQGHHGAVLKSGFQPDWLVGVALLFKVVLFEQRRASAAVVEDCGPTVVDARVHGSLV